MSMKIDELLAIACVSVKPIPGTEDERPRYARLFATGAKIRESCSADEVAALFAMYLQVQRKYGPHSRTVQSDDDLNWWIKRLAEGGEHYPLASLDSLALAELASSLAARAYSLSRILESLPESSPTTSASDLKSWGIGTGYFGSPLAEASADGGANSDGGTLLGVDPGELVTPEQAAEIAKRFKPGGGLRD